MIDERIRHWSNNPKRPIDEVVMEYSLLKSEFGRGLNGVLTEGILKASYKRTRLLEEIYGRIGRNHGNTLIERTDEAVKLIDS